MKSPGRIVNTSINTALILVSNEQFRHDLSFLGNNIHNQECLTFSYLNYSHGVLLLQKHVALILCILI
jgi:hypothetical protein